MVSFGLEPSAGIWNALIKGYRKYGSLGQSQWGFMSVSCT
jgi:hypothetical protein